VRRRNVLLIAGQCPEHVKVCTGILYTVFDFAVFRKKPYIVGILQFLAVIFRQL